jgi:ferredoxin-thioredoxin reductase catalytic subunit
MKPVEEMSAEELILKLPLHPNDAGYDIEIEELLARLRERDAAKKWGEKHGDACSHGRFVLAAMQSAREGKPGWRVGDAQDFVDEVLSGGTVSPEIPFDRIHPCPKCGGYTSPEALHVCEAASPEGKDADSTQRALEVVRQMAKAAKEYFSLPDNVITARNLQNAIAAAEAKLKHDEDFGACCGCEYKHIAAVADQMARFLDQYYREETMRKGSTCNCLLCLRTSAALAEYYKLIGKEKP